MKKGLLLGIILMIQCTLSAQTSYDDVAVIVNTNSTASMNIGNHFKNSRNIPDQNMIYVSAPITEDIDSMEFELLRGQIENYLIANNLESSINYLVTTKGIPLTVNNGCVVDTLPGASCAAVDAELVLILGNYASEIGQTSSIPNPIFDTEANFDRDNVGIYLVTRLDGYTVADVYRMIDNSGPETGINPLSAQAIVDISAATGGDSLYFVDYYAPTYDTLIAAGWNATFDADYLPLVNQENVFGYFGLGHGPLPSATFNYEWTKGSVASMSMCNSAFTFDQATNTANGVLIADLIADGCTGALGHVDYIYFSQITPMEIFVDRYYDPIETYNLAESYYMAERRLSWQTVIIGDPKASVVLDNFATLPEPEAFEFTMYPNPASDAVTISSSQTMVRIDVLDMNGRTVKSLDVNSESHVELLVDALLSGVYLIQIETDNGQLHQERLMVK